MRQSLSDDRSVPALGLRPWQRLSVRLACLPAAVTLLAVAAVGGFTYKRHQDRLTVRLRYAAQGPESEDIFGKVVRADGEGAERLARIHLTSTSDADALRLEGLLLR